MMKKLLFTLLILSALTANSQGTVCVDVFNDINANGVLDENEPGVSDIFITVIAAPQSFQNPLPYGESTNDVGNYCFTDLPYGQYTFAVEVPEGWIFDGSPVFTVDIIEGNDNTGNSFRFNFEDDPLSTDSYNQSQFSVYPNPATDIINFAGNKVEGSKVMIFDTSGKCVVTLDLSVNRTVDVGTLLPGVYIAQLTGAQYNETVKFVVNR